jgi:EmrB/QacA subfamily drug resistance transporter
MARSGKTSVLTPELRRTSTIVVLGSVMSILDTTIVAVALPTLARDFHVSVSTIQWVATGYLLALAVVTPVTGWAVDRFGAKAVWLLSTSLFIIGSSLCGLAWSANSLIAFRVLQGIGGGMLLPVGQSILARAAGPQRMGRVMSIIGVPMVMGPILGPIIGGLIVSNYTWRWIFYINVPIGILTLILSQRWLPKFDTEERYTSAFDSLGFCLLSPGLAALVYALSEIGTSGSFTSPSVLVSFFLGVVLMTAFILHALRIRNPLLELHPFKHRNFAIANICIFVIGATLFGSMFLLPLYYQVARGQEAWQAGLLMAPQGIGAACIMRWAGSVTDRLGPRRVVPFGILLMAGATVPFAFVSASTNEILLAMTLFARGVGLGLSMMPVTAAAYYDLKHAEIPKASTVMNIMRLIGGSVATATFAVVLERQIVSNLGPLAAKSGGSAGVIGATVKLPPQVTDPVAAAFAHTFWWSVFAILIAFIPTLFLPSRAPQPVPTGADSVTEDADTGEEAVRQAQASDGRGSREGGVPAAETVPVVHAETGSVPSAEEGTEAGGSRIAGVVQD